MTQHLHSQEPHGNSSTLVYAKGLPVCHTWLLDPLKLMNDLPLTKRGHECHAVVSGFTGFPNSPPLALLPLLPIPKLSLQLSLAASLKPLSLNVGGMGF